jgi:hypothetical protein
MKDMKYLRSKCTSQHLVLIQHLAAVQGKARLTSKFGRVWPARRDASQDGDGRKGVPCTGPGYRYNSLISSCGGLRIHPAGIGRRRVLWGCCAVCEFTYFPVPPSGMFSVSVSDIIHPIQYYYHTSSYDNAATDAETFRLEPLRGKYPSWPRSYQYVRADRRAVFRHSKEPRCSYATSDPWTSQCLSLRCRPTSYSNPRSSSTSTR